MYNLILSSVPSFLVGAKIGSTKPLKAFSFRVRELEGVDQAHAMILNLDPKRRGNEMIAARFNGINFYLHH